jgi:hypothetical protein
VPVLHGTTWLDVDQLNPPLFAAVEEMPAGQLGPVVTTNRFRFSVELLWVDTRENLSLRSRWQFIEPSGNARARGGDRASGKLRRRRPARQSHSCNSLLSSASISSRAKSALESSGPNIFAAIRRCRSTTKVVGSAEILPSLRVSCTLP